MPQLTSESSQRLESAGINAYAKARETYLKHSKASKDKSQTESKKDKEREDKRGIPKIHPNPIKNPSEVPISPS